MPVPVVDPDPGVAAGPRDRSLETEQWVPASLDRTFAFFADAGNLESLTPGPTLGRIFCFRRGAIARALGPDPGGDRGGVRFTVGGRRENPLRGPRPLG